MKTDMQEIGKKMTKNPERWQLRGRELWFLCSCEIWHPVTRLGVPHKQTRAFLNRFARARRE